MVNQDYKLDWTVSQVDFHDWQEKWMGDNGPEIYTPTIPIEKLSMALQEILATLLEVAQVCMTAVLKWKLEVDEV